MRMRKETNEKLDGSRPRLKTTFFSPQGSSRQATARAGVPRRRLRAEPASCHGPRGASGGGRARELHPDAGRAGRFMRQPDSSHFTPRNRTEGNAATSSRKQVSKAAKGKPNRTRVSNSAPEAERRDSSIRIGDQTRVLSLNIEGISAAKCQILSVLLEKHEVDIVLLQETHLGRGAAKSRQRIDGYSLVAAEWHTKYGTAVYAKRPGMIRVVGSQTEDNGTQTITINTGNLTITNVYKPPGLGWSNPPRERTQHPEVVVGDFNSHSSEWGYPRIDRAGRELSAWADALDLQLVHSSKDEGTFKPRNSQRTFSPDLVFATKDENLRPVPVVREVLNDFPRTQHRPILLKVGIQIPTPESVPLPRWNFRKADWFAYAQQVDNECEGIAPRQENLDLFTRVILRSARDNIPRGFRRNYIPCWTPECRRLLDEYERTKDPETADALMAALDAGRRDRWVEKVESLDLKHSSRHPWQLLKKLEPASSTCRSAPAVTADQIAREIKARGMHTPDNRREAKIRKAYARLHQRLPKQDARLTAPVRPTEMAKAVGSLKNGKAAGRDGVYPDMLSHLGPRTREWLCSALTDVILTGNYPQIWRSALVVAILKPGKPADDPASYRPISLLSCLFKLLERIVLNRIKGFVTLAVPKEQAGFQEGRDTTEQVLALTTHIEAGMEKKLKTGAVLVDLSAAYDTVWTGGLLFKLAHSIPCQTTLNLLRRMVTTRQFRVALGSDLSRTRRIRNGVPQGSVLAPALFNVYISDMPATESLKLGYADDWALVHQARSFEELERVLSEDTTSVKKYFDQWYLKMNTAKTVSCVFHLNTHKADRLLTVQADGAPLPAAREPRYLGVVLDRTLTFKAHLTSSSQKLSARSNLIRKLAGTTWGANQGVLRTSTLALCSSVAEYCAPVWARSAHTNKIDVKMRDAMRTVTGCLKSTPREWLPVLSSIAPPHLRREEISQRWIKRATESLAGTPLESIIRDAPHTSRLKSRRPFYHVERNEKFNLKEAWRKEWSEKGLKRGNLVSNPCRKQPGFDSGTRRQWVFANRLRTGHARTAANLHRWGLISSPICPRCKQAPQNLRHLVRECEMTKLPGGHAEIQAFGPGFIDWLDRTAIQV